MSPVFCPEDGYVAETFFKVEVAMSQGVISIGACKHGHIVWKHDKPQYDFTSYTTRTVPQFADYLKNFHGSALGFTADNIREALKTYESYQKESA